MGRDDENSDQAEWLSLIDALAVFCERWRETPLPSANPSSGKHGGFGILLKGGLVGVWAELQAAQWVGEIQCRARRADPTAPMEMLPAKALHHFRLVDLIGEVIESPTGERFYEPMFRRAKPAACVLDWHSEWIPIKQAAREVSVHRDTMERWAVRHGIGRRIGGRWQIDRRRLSAFFEKMPYPELSSLRGISPECPSESK